MTMMPWYPNALYRVHSNTMHHSKLTFVSVPDFSNIHRFGSVRFGSVRFGSVRFGSEQYLSRFDVVRPAFFGRVVAGSSSVRFVSASGSGRFLNLNGSVRFGSADSVRFLTPSRSDDRCVNLWRFHGDGSVVVLPISYTYKVKIPWKGKSLIKGNPLQREIPYTIQLSGARDLPWHFQPVSKILSKQDDDNPRPLWKHNPPNNYEDEKTIYFLFFVLQQKQ